MTRNLLPSSACAAVAPSATITFGPDQSELLLQPRSARANLGRGRLLVQPPLGQLDPSELEVLHRVGHVDPAPVDPGRDQRLVEQPPRRPHERMPLPVLLVARLLAYHHHFGAAGTFAEHRLGRRAGRGGTRDSSAAAARSEDSVGRAGMKSAADPVATARAPPPSLAAVAEDAGTVQQRHHRSRAHPLPLGLHAASSTRAPSPRPSGVHGHAKADDRDMEVVWVTACAISRRRSPRSTPAARRTAA